MNIKGKEITLRATDATDNPMLLKIINDEATEYMLGGRSFPVSEKAQEEWLNNLKSYKCTLRCAVYVQG